MCRVFIVVIVVVDSVQVGVVMIIVWHAGLVCLELELMDGEGEGEIPVLLGAIKPSADLRAVRLIVSRPPRNLDLRDVRVFGGICGPLHQHPGSSNTRDNTVHQLKLGDLEVGHWFVPFPHMSLGVQDRLFVSVEELEGGGNLSKLGVIELS